MKSLKFLSVIFTLIFVISTSVQSQVKMKKPKYPQFSISPVGGVAFPVSQFGDNFKTGPTFGLDFSIKVNKEVGFYAKFGYYIFTSKLSSSADGKILEYTAGPRYYFTAKNLKSAIFLEAGLGGYTFMQDAYTSISNGDTTSVADYTSTDFGINAGVGAVLNLSKAVDLIIKAKYHNILTTDGSTSFIAPVLGVDIRFN